MPVRPNFADEAIRASFTPGPGNYKPKMLQHKVLGNVAFKNDRISYLTEAMHNAKDSIPPGQYDPKVNYNIDWQHINH